MSSSDSDNESVGSHAVYETISSADEGEEVAPRRLPKRKTRGTRTHKLVGEDAEADAAFWEQDAFGEEDDANYEFKEQRDIVDSDIDLSEGEEETDEVIVAKEKKKVSSRAYREPTAKRKRPGRSSTSVGVPGSRAKRQRTRSVAMAGQVMGRQSLRRSTQNKSAMMQELRAAENAKSTANKVRRKRMREMRQETEDNIRATQEEMLLEAVNTEMKNRSYLQKLQNERVAKRKIPIRKQRGEVPMIRFHSKKGALNTISFSHQFSDIPKVINCPRTVYEKRPTRCIITRLPAKYRVRFHHEFQI